MSISKLVSWVTFDQSELTFGAARLWQELLESPDVSKTFGEDGNALFLITTKKSLIVK